MRLVFMGTGEIGVPTLRAMHDSEHDVAAVVTQPDRAVGRSQTIEASPIKKVASQLNLPVLQPARLRERSAIKQIAELKPDAVVVMAYGQILPPELLHE